MANLKCIKAVLAEKGIMSKWCNNHSQPDLYTLARIAEVLDADIHRMISMKYKRNQNAYRS